MNSKAGRLSLRKITNYIYIIFDKPGTHLCQVKYHK
jgi:hypothetical protein